MAAVLDIKSTVIESAAADASFDPYGRLLRVLMPSLRGVVVHDGFGNLVWTSDEWDLAGEPDLIKHTIANALADAAEFAGVVRTLNADRAAYSFAIRGEHIDLLGVVSLIAQLSVVNSRCDRNWVLVNAISMCANATSISCSKFPRIRRRPRAIPTNSDSS